MNLASSSNLSNRKRANIAEHRSRHFQISVMLTVATWSIAWSFFSFIFWIIAIGALAFAFLLSAKRDSHSKPATWRDFAIAGGLFALLVGQAIWGAMHEYYNVDEILFVAVSIPLAILLSKRRVDPVMSWIPFFATTTYFFALITLGVGVENLLPQNSRNFLSVILIGLFASALVLSKPERVTVLHIGAALIILWFSVISIGRSGIIASFALVLLLMSLKMFSGPSSWKKRLLSTLLLVGISVAFLTSLDQILESVPRLASRGIHDYSRNFIHMTFFRELEGPSFIFGQNYFQIFQLHRYNYNLHSSYLSSWANLGLVYTLIVVICIGRSLISMKTFPVIWVALVALGLRAATDIQMIGAKFDYVFLVMLFLAAKKPMTSDRRGERPNYTFAENRPAPSLG
ncbi:hypothetical protein BPTFM16_02132 [Altererythrobacter insulae]|nr:hypothetical protein BPTFM16_02132 [Altererythrobacter insulae]